MKNLPVAKAQDAAACLLWRARSPRCRTRSPQLFADLYGSVIDKGRLNSVNDLAKAKQYVNRAYADVALVSKYWEGSAVGAALAASATNQSIPAAIIELEQVTVTYAGIQPPMREVTFEQLTRQRSWTLAGQGPPQIYAVRKATVEFWPSAQGTEVLTYYGSTQPPAWLSADADVPDIPEPFATSLLEYGALVQVGEFKNDLLMLGEYQQSYGAWLSKFMKFVATRQGTDARAFPVRYGGSMLLPHDRSSDWYTMAGVTWA